MGAHLADQAIFLHGKPVSLGELHPVDIVVEQRELGAPCPARRRRELLLAATRGSSQERRSSRARLPRECRAWSKREEHGEYLEQLGRVPAHGEEEEEEEESCVAAVSPSRRCSVGCVRPVFAATCNRPGSYERSRPENSRSAEKLVQFWHGDAFFLSQRAARKLPIRLRPWLLVAGDSHIGMRRNYNEREGVRVANGGACGRSTKETSPFATASSVHH